MPNQIQSSNVKMSLVIIIVIIFLVMPRATHASEVIDSDNDGLQDALELSLGTNVNGIDTDGDTFDDGEEVANGFNPLQGDRDRSLVRRVEVDRTTQRLTYFLNNVPINTLPVSTGILGRETPAGEFTILFKRPLVHYLGVDYDFPNTKWNLEFKNHYYLHGAYWHKQFGIRPMSHGCVNIAYKDVEKLYKFLDVGDKVQIIGKTPRGKVQVASIVKP
ncbi:MAG: murein L,D-transpeptidase [Candidatus Magasanikbacteria bacterium]|nr:murein L,D-transpeptidase [Candidatus Magasanikbacteria bacterium]